MQGMKDHSAPTFEVPICARTCKGSQFNALTALRDSAAACIGNDRRISWRKAHLIVQGPVWSMVCSLEQLRSADIK